MKTTLLLVDDHAAIRELIASHFADDILFSVVGQAANGTGALRLCAQAPPKIMVLDLAMPVMCGLLTLRQIRRRYPEIRTVIFSGTTNETLVSAVLAERPLGFVHKSERLDTLAEAIRAVALGYSFLAPYATKIHHHRRGIEHANQKPLTEREQEVLQLIAEGSTNKGIAGRMHISIKTVEHHRSQLMRKLDRRDIAGLTRYAVSRGLVEAH